jgi:hypothetical protein
MNGTPDDVARQKAARDQQRTPEEKLLDKLTALKRKAEGAAAIGSEAEAQAFAEKLQSLLLEHDLSMSDIEFERMEAEEPIGQQWVMFEKHGFKRKKTRTAWMERLASMVARANFCRIIVSSGTSNFFLVGRPEHRAVAEYMIVTLTRAVMDISKKEHTKYVWEVYKRDRSTSGAKGFKDSFITAFLMRLFERMEARKAAAGVSTSTALMRLNKEDAAVEQHMQKRRELDKDDPNSTRKAHGLKVALPSSREGVRRGQAAADAVNLDGKAIANTGTLRKQLV